MQKKILLIILVNLILLNFLAAQTWDGSASTDWNTPANWSTNAVPTATGNVIIPSSLATYPVLASNVTINSINMQAGSQLDFKGFAITINTTNQYNYFTGATLNNSNAGSDIVVNINTGGGGYSEYVRSTTVNDNITFNLSGTNAFYEADNAGTANTYMGNVTFNISSALGLYLSDNGASQYNGNLVINRPAGGATQIFNGGGDVTGNFSFTNNIDGGTILGNAAKKTTISGTITIAVNQVTPAAFQLLHIINQTTGGTINAQNTQGFNVQKDTLKVSTFSVTGYRGANYGYFYNNNITGDITIADDATYAGGYATYIRYNEITGNATFTNNGSNAMNEADVAGSGNHYTGNVSFTCKGSGPLYISDSDTSYYDGNLSLNRTATGITQGFNSGGVIGGNFSFTNNTAGNALFGNLSTKTSIGGTVNISLNDVTPGNFQLHHIINQTTGGTINAQNTSGFTVQKDTLKVTALSVTGYRGANYGYFYNNDITGNITIADDASYTGGYATYIRYNEITGNATFTNNGSNAMYDADVASSGNHYTGNVSFTCAGSGPLYISDSDTSYYDGNLAINRTVTGITQGFNSGGVIGGNFSYTNNTAGNTLFGNLSTKTSIGGTVNISLNDVTPGNFQLHYIINQTTGGTINAQNTQGFTVQKDTLKVTAFSVTGYRGPNYGYFFNNDITGNITIADDATYAGGYATYIRYNEITGNATFTNNGTNTMYDADVAGSGNKYSGNLSYTKNGGPVTIGTADTTEIGANLTLNSTTGITTTKIKFNGNADGVIDQTGTQPIIINQMIVEKTGSGKLTLNDSVTVSGGLALNSGIIMSSTASNLIFPDNVSYTGGSDISYVDGPILKTGNDAFIFPLGQINVYAPVSITAPSNITDQFRGQYLNVVPHDAGYDSTQHDPSLNHISRKEYWLLDRITGTSNVKVTLSWNQNRSGFINDIPNLRVARWNGSTWKDEGNGGTTGNNTQGTIQSQNSVSSFSPFTLASTNALNPLPVTLLNFAATKCNNNVCLEWTIENEKNFSHFEIEKSNGDSHFDLAGIVNANNSAGINQYTFTDLNPNRGLNYYRLKLVDIDGNFKYSKIEPILFSNRSAITVYPNPAKGLVRILASKKITSIEVTDVSGKLIKKMTVNANNLYDINDLHQGLHFLKIRDEEKTTVIKLFVQ